VATERNYLQNARAPDFSLMVELSGKSGDPSGFEGVELGFIASPISKSKYEQPAKRKEHYTLSQIHHFVQTTRSAYIKIDNALSEGQMSFEVPDFWRVTGKPETAYSRSFHFPSEGAGAFRLLNAASQQVLALATGFSFMLLR
jgi:hypothetical protein